MATFSFSGFVSKAFLIAFQLKESNVDVSLLGKRPFFPCCYDVAVVVDMF